ncbi:MAG: hypothetical protein ABL956_16810 [Hyphomonadaceae bacterium]
MWLRGNTRKAAKGTARYFGHRSTALAQLTQPTTKPAAEENFDKSDANKDGALPVAEVQAADAKARQADFHKYDVDDSKSLSTAEFKQWVEARTTAPASAPVQ